MKARQLARQLALQALFEIDLAHHAPDVVLRERFADCDPPPSAETTDFTRRIVYGVIRHLETLDTIIARYAPEWPVAQIAVIDRNILRMALWEIGFEQTPLKVVINEAVELAKTFGSDASPRFVNGVLGAATRNEAGLRKLLQAPTTAGASSSQA
jgi:N utilization substance protein B